MERVSMARSAKQRRNDRRLGRAAKSRFRKTNKARPIPKSVPRRSKRKSSRVKNFISRRGGARGIGGGLVNTIKPMATGIGMGEIAETIAVRAGQPQFATMAGYGGAYLGGGLKGLAGKVVFDMLLGRGSPLQSLGLFGSRAEVSAL